MVVNNYEAMQMLENKYKYQDLSVDMILDLHTIFLKNDKIIKKDKIGCFRSNKDNIYVGNDNYYTHKAPEINYAKNELVHGVISIGTLAEQCGFADIYSFSHAFKRATGFSPTEWSSL
jgi:AraC-like DNA-binding protein